MNRYICSIDIGKKNFAFCIEKFSFTELKKTKRSFHRYNKDGTPTEELQSVLDSIYSNGEIILHDNIDLTKNCDASKKLDPETFFNMTDVLDELSEYWKKCDTILIEEQMAFGARVNKMAVKLAQHCYSYFILKYGKTKTVIEYPAYHKTQVLGAPKVMGKKRWKAMAKHQRKKWAVDKTIEILTHRGEIEVVDSLTSVSKRDDLADTFLMIQSYKYQLI